MHLLLLVTLLVLCSSAVAQTEQQLVEFNEAWHRHAENLAAGNHVASVDTARDLLDLGRAFLPPQDDQLATLIYQYGYALFKAGRNYDARDAFLQALEIREGLYGPQALELVDTIKAAADAWGGHPEFAQRHLAGYKRALKIVGRHYGKDSLEYADLLLETGAALYDQSRSNIGDKRIRDALAIYEEQCSEPNIRRGTAAYYLGKIRYGTERTNDAIRYLEDALKNFAGDTDELRMNRLRTMALLVQAYERKGRQDEVTRYSQRIGLEMQFTHDQELVPLITVNPMYPEQFADRGIEGYVVVQFSIDHEGRVVNPVAIEEDIGFSTHAKIGGGTPRNMSGMEYESLAEAAVDAVQQYRYAPRYVDGKAVVVTRATVRVDFELKR